MAVDLIAQLLEDRNLSLDRLERHLFDCSQCTPTNDDPNWIKGFCPAGMVVMDLFRKVERSFLEEVFKLDLDGDVRR